jgi:hypothetical protein
MKPRDLKCFDEVAHVIGESGAEIELYEVINSLSERGIDTTAEDLEMTFTWGSTPQGYNFWRAIHEGILPAGEAYAPACRVHNPVDEPLPNNELEKT